jgi:uncharacterized cupin superfamily protein
MADGVTHLDQAPARDFAIGHLRSRWTFLGEAAGSVAVGLRRIQVEPGAWATPIHDHGSEEEIFYVLGGSGLSWHRGAGAEIGAEDCIVYLAGRGGHSLRAGEDGLDVLAFGPRHRDGGTRFERLGISLVGGRAVRTEPPTVERVPVQFVREAELGPPELPPNPGPRPDTVVSRSDVTADPLSRPRVERVRRNLGRAAGSADTGLQYVEVAPGRESTAQHCHSLEEELFVILDGEGVLLLGESEEVPVQRGSVISRPAATGVAHCFRAGESGLSYLAYGTREPGDMCWYPRSRKIAFRGLGVIARVAPTDYWDGED